MSIRNGEIYILRKKFPNTKNPENKLTKVYNTLFKFSYSSLIFHMKREAKKSNRKTKFIRKKQYLGEVRWILNLNLNWRKPNQTEPKLGKLGKLVKLAKVAKLGAGVIFRCGFSSKATYIELNSQLSFSKPQPNCFASAAASGIQFGNFSSNFFCFKIILSCIP